jgi:hypothetical protein
MGKGGLKAREGLGDAGGVDMDRPDARPNKGNRMAHEEPILTDPPTQEVASHVQDYERFTKLFKWGAIISLIIAFAVILIIS